MELKITNKDNDCRGDHLVKNIPDEVWDEFKRLAKVNGLTVSKMFEVLVDIVSKD